MKASHSLVALVLLASLAGTYCIKCYTYTDATGATPPGVAAGDKKYQSDCTDGLGGFIKSNGKCYRASSADAVAGCGLETVSNCQDMTALLKASQPNTKFYCSECDKDWCNNTSGLRAGFLGAVMAAVSAVLSLY